MLILVVKNTSLAFFDDDETINDDLQNIVKIKIFSKKIIFMQFSVVTVM
jgi:hypothetical protein